MIPPRSKSICWAALFFLISLAFLGHDEWSACAGLRSAAPSVCATWPHANRASSSIGLSLMLCKLLSLRSMASHEQWWQGSQTRQRQGSQRMRIGRPGSPSWPGAVPVTERLEGIGAAFWMRSCTLGLHFSYSAAPNSEMRRSFIAW